MDTVLSPEEQDAVEGLVGQAVVRAEVLWEREHVVGADLQDGARIVIKRPRRSSEGDDGPTPGALAAFAAERSALELLASSPGSPAPRFVGYDPAAGVLVMEHLPPGRSVAELLLGDDEDAAKAAVVAYGDALGRLHAAAVGREGDYVEIRLRGADDPAAALSQPRWATVDEERIAALQPLLSSVGVAHRPAVGEECREIVDELRSPGWWRTLVHGDPCPDNTRLLDGSHGRGGSPLCIFDYEASGYSSALLDACYLVAPFPTCWCFGRVPAAVAAAGVAAHRAVLGTVRPEALDDREWDRRLAAALASWLVMNAGRTPALLEADHEWGTSGVRARVLTWLDTAGDAMEKAERFPALAAATRMLQRELASRWPGAAVGDYPALQTGGPFTVTIPTWWRPGL